MGGGVLNSTLIGRGAVLRGSQWGRSPQLDSDWSGAGLNNDNEVSFYAVN